MRRKAVEELTLRKNMTIATMTAAFWANTNLDSKENEGVRGRMIDELTSNVEAKFAETLAMIYGAEDPNAIDEIDMNDPFYSAMQVPDSVRAEMMGKE